MLAMVLNYISLMILAVIGFFGDERTAQFVQGQFQYSNWDVPWMTMDRCVDSCAEHIVIPGGITHNGRYYPVAEIGHDAFRGMHNLVDVTIEMYEMVGDKTETRATGIGFNRGAFKDCPSLSVIQVNDTIPPGIGKHPFYGGELTDVFEPYHLEGTIIVVPPGFEDRYRNAEGWREFKYIQSTWPSPDEYHIDALDVRINELESELKRAQGTVERLQHELDGLRQSRESKKRIRD